MSIETIGDRVKARRLAMDMSQEDLAKALGYKSKASIFKIENGAGDIPRNKLPKFASILNCSISYLTGWNELQTIVDEHIAEPQYDILGEKKVNIVNDGIGENIRKMRKKRGISQTQLANKLGYKSKSSIAKIENGNGDIPRSKLPQFAAALNCSISYLTGWNELQTFDDEHKVETPYDILCNKIGQLPPSDLNAVSEYVDFMLTKNKER